jgi:hypothetical protein
MYIYYVAKARIIEVPQVIKQVFPIYDLIRVPHKIFKQPEFLEREGDLFAVYRDAAV